MAISTYTELKTAVGNWLHRAGETEIVARIPEFITLAENRINRRIRLIEQETEATAPYSGSSNKVDLPAGFIELLDLKVKKATDSDFLYELVRHVPSDRIQEYYSTATGKPLKYAIRSQIEFDRLPDMAYTLKMHYVKKWDIASDTTNWLLTNHPGVYLYGTLLEANPYIQNNEYMQIWEAYSTQALEEIDEVDQRNRDDEVLSVSDLAEMNQNYGYNINRDY